MKTDGDMRKGGSWLFFSFNETLFQLFSVTQGMIPEPPVGHWSTEIKSKESEQVLGNKWEVWTNKEHFIERPPCTWGVRGEKLRPQRRRGGRSLRGEFPEGGCRNKGGSCADLIKFSSVLFTLGLVTQLYLCSAACRVSTRALWRTRGLGLGCKTDFYLNMPSLVRDNPSLLFAWFIYCC